jgi:predicted component of viral defense system (DUF524 family)
MRISAGPGRGFLLYSSGAAEPDLHHDFQTLSTPFEFTARSCPEPDSNIRYDPDAPNRGIQILSLMENVRYRWRLTIPPGSPSPQIASTLESPGKADWSTPERISPELITGDFRVTNYLGTASIQIDDFVLRFEVQTRKFDYESEYRWMVEEVAQKCQQLLLEWDSPTSFTLVPDPEREARSLLERFLFLRYVAGGDRLHFHLELIRQRPHVALRREREWQPSSLAVPSLFVRDPLRYGRDWRRQRPAGIVASFTPGQILQERKYETYDTPANRFVKFALQNFRDLCEQVLASRAGRNEGTAFLEARALRDLLDSFLSQPFFLSVGQLERIPFESQTLQKREGYRDILQTWLVLEAAARLNWRGRELAYDGTNRDAATLYEYWLFFVLRSILKQRLNMSEIVPPKRQPDSPDFCQVASDGLEIRLTQGVESLCRFTWTSQQGQSLAIHLFYNRKFTSRKSPRARGSYSRTFRPDFTLVFFPAPKTARAPEAAESQAEETGKIGYMHFDAKYRLDSLEQLFGVADETRADEDLAREHAETKATSTYKRGDLFKMHTYNEAIRRTAGSFVLYPGAQQETFERYEEIVPGVGAFPMRPSSTLLPAQEQCLASFIHDVLNHHVNAFSRDYRIRYWTQDTLEEVPPSCTPSTPKAQAPRPPADTLVLISQYRNWRVAKRGRKKEFSFIHAISATGKPTHLDPRALKADLFLPYTTQHPTGKLCWLGWFAPIKQSKLVSRQDLINDYLNSEELLQSDTQYYYLIQLGPPTSLDRSLLQKVSTLVKRKGYPVTRKWTELFGPAKSKREVTASRLRAAEGSTDNLTWSA